MQRIYVPSMAGDWQVSVVVEVKWSMVNGRMTIRVGDADELVPALVTAVKCLSKADQHWLWALLDETLANYEDHLLATHPDLVREHEKALGEIERGEYVVYRSEVES